MTPTMRANEDSNNTRTTIVTLAVAALVAGIAFISIRALEGGDGTSPVAPVSATVASTAVAGVTVAVPSVDLGPVPLNKDINQTFTLKNSGTGKAQLGKPRIETLEGC